MTIIRTAAILLAMSAAAPATAQAVVQSGEVPSRAMKPPPPIIMPPPPVVSLQSAPPPMTAAPDPSETQCRNMARAAATVAGYATRFAATLAQCRVAYPHPDPKIQFAEPKGSRDLVAKVPSRVPSPPVS